MRSPRRSRPHYSRAYPTVRTAYDSATSKVTAANTEIKNAIDEWFGVAGRIEQRIQEIKDLGDKAAITTDATASRSRLTGSRPPRSSLTRKSPSTKRSPAN